MIIYILYKKPAFFNQLIPVYNCPSVKAGIMMTKNLLMGNIRGQLVQLAFPLLLGNVLQQLYNAVDSIIIGRFVGSTAFAAVGVAGTVMNLFVFMISGVCVGVSILFAQLYGAQDLDGYRREVFLALSLGSGFTLVLTILSLMGLPWILRLIQTPAEVAGEAEAYLRIIFCGFLAAYWYNLCAAILRSVGNTRIPLLFLAVAAAINTGLDLLFVAAFSMGVTGAAAATVIAQLISAACCSAYIWKRIPFAVFRRQDMAVDRGAAVPDRPVRTGVCTATIQPVYWKTAGTGRCELLGHRLHLRLHCRYPHRGVCQLVWRQWRRSNRHFCGAKYWSRTGKTCGKRIFCRYPDDGCPMPVRLYGNVLFCAVSDILFSWWRRAGGDTPRGDVSAHCFLFLSILLFRRVFCRIFPRHRPGKSPRAGHIVAYCHPGCSFLSADHPATAGRRSDSHRCRLDCRCLFA